MTNIHLTFTKFIKLKLYPYLLILVNVLVLGLTTACFNQGGLGTPRTGASTTTTDTDDQPTVALPPSNPVVPSDPANPTQEGSTITHLPGTAIPETVPPTSHLPIALPASNPATQPQLGPTIYDLPKDLFTHICSFLDPEALHNFLSTCKQFYNKRVTEPDSSRLSTALGIKINSVRDNEGKSYWGYFDYKKSQFKRVPPSLYPLVRKISKFIDLKKEVLDLANFPKLRELTLDFIQCKKEDIDSVSEVLNKVKKLQNLESLVISYLPSLENNPNVKEGNINIFETLKEIIQKNNIKKFKISHTYPGPEREKIKEFLEEVIVSSSLEELDLSLNGLLSEDIKCLTEALKTNQTLRVLNLCSNRICAQGATILAEALKHNKSLQMLDLEGNQIGDEGVKSLAEFLKINETLQVLNLARNKISKEGIEYLFKALENNKSLLELDLRGHSIDKEFAEKLATMLPLIVKNSNLRKLYLSYDITSNGQTINHEVRNILVRALNGNKRLQLFFSW